MASYGVTMSKSHIDYTCIQYIDIRSHVSGENFVVYKYTQSSIKATSNNITSTLNKIKSHIQC